MIQRGGKADEPVLAVGEATEGASTKIQKKPFTEEKDDTISQKKAEIGEMSPLFADYSFISNLSGSFPRNTMSRTS